MTFNIDKLQRLAEFAEATSLWRPADVTQEPETRLQQWQVYQVWANASYPKDSIHFVGHTGGYHGEGRVCSAVQTYDKERHRGVTKSGRVYELVGHPGHNRDADYVWNRWLGLMGDPEFTEVTNQYE